MPAAEEARRDAAEALHPLGLGNARTRRIAAPALPGERWMRPSPGRSAARWRPAARPRWPSSTRRCAAAVPRRTQSRGRRRGRPPLLLTRRTGRRSQGLLGLSTSISIRSSSGRWLTREDRELRDEGHQRRLRYALPAPPSSGYKWRTLTSMRSGIHRRGSPRRSYFSIFQATKSAPGHHPCPESRYSGACSARRRAGASAPAGLWRVRGPGPGFGGLSSFGNVGGGRRSYCGKGRIRVGGDKQSSPDTSKTHTPELGPAYGAAGARQRVTLTGRGRVRGAAE